ncbi:hypothetical protein U9M48_043531, partial [Paspalum notatum var. saurae]
AVQPCEPASFTLPSAEKMDAIQILVTRQVWKNKFLRETWSLVRVV